jgi:hypothetical protein
MSICPNCNELHLSIDACPNPQCSGKNIINITVEIHDSVMKVNDLANNQVICYNDVLYITGNYTSDGYYREFINLLNPSSCITIHNYMYVHTTNLYIPAIIAKITTTIEHIKDPQR